MFNIPFAFIVFAFLMLVSSFGLAVQTRRLKRKEDRVFSELDGHLKDIYQKLDDDEADAYERGRISGMYSAMELLKREHTDIEARYFGKR